MSASVQNVTFPNPGDGHIPFRMDLYNRSFVSGHDDSNSLRVRYFFRQADKHVIAYAWFGPHAEGPPNFAHGGSMAAVLDEAMGATPWANYISVVAASITVHFKEMLPLGKIATVECWIEKIDGRKISTKGKITDGNNKVFALGEGLYIKVPIEKFANIPKEDIEKYKNKRFE